MKKKKKMPMPMMSEMEDKHKGMIKHDGKWVKVGKKKKKY